MLDFNTQTTTTTILYKRKLSTKVVWFSMLVFKSSSSILFEKLCASSNELYMTRYPTNFTVLMAFYPQLFSFDKSDYLRDGEKATHFVLEVSIYHSIYFCKRWFHFEAYHSSLGCFRGIPEKVHPFSKGICKNLYTFCCSGHSIRDLEVVPTMEDIEARSRPYTCLDVIVCRCCWTIFFLAFFFGFQFQRTFDQRVIDYNEVECGHSFSVASHITVSLKNFNFNQNESGFQNSILFFTF